MKDRVRLRGRARFPESGVSVPDDFQFHYKLDGTDSSLVRVGGDDFRLGPECTEAISSQFDGSTQYYTANADSSLVAIGTGAFTISFWINKFTSTLADILTSGDGNAASSFRVFCENGNLKLRSNNADYVSISTSYSNGKWNYCTLTSTGSGGTLSFYLNGTLDNSTTAPAYNLTDTTFLTVGSSTGGLNFFDGAIDGIRFYDRVLDGSEISSLDSYKCDFNPSLLSSLIWFDAQDQTTITETAGDVSQWSDKSGNAYHLIQNTGAEQPSTFVDNTNGLNAISATGSEVV